MTKLSGGLNNWYVVPVAKPQRKEQEPYQAECEDIIQALGMTFDEGCAFKALWRNAAARLGNGKPGNTAVYDAEKLVHYANRVLNKEKIATEVNPQVLGQYDWHLPKTVKRNYQGIRVLVVGPNGAQSTLPMERVIWGNVSKFKFIDKIPDGFFKEEDNGWIYSKVQPRVTRPYKTILVEYDNGMQFEYPFMHQVRWHNVRKYKVVYS